MTRDQATILLFIVALMLGATIGNNANVNARLASINATLKEIDTSVYHLRP